MYQRKKNTQNKYIKNVKISGLHRNDANLCDNIHRDKKLLKSASVQSAMCITKQQFLNIHSSFVIKILSFDYEYLFYLL